MKRQQEGWNIFFLFVQSFLLWSFFVEILGLNDWYNKLIHPKKFFILENCICFILYLLKALFRSNRWLQIKRTKVERMLSNIIFKFVSIQWVRAIVLRIIDYIIVIITWNCRLKDSCKIILTFLHSLVLILLNISRVFKRASLVVLVCVHLSC
jgi:hypothetical protein